MHIKASGRSALIIAFGLSIGVWGGLQPTRTLAAPAAETAANEAPAAAKAAAKKTAKPRAVQAKPKPKPAKPVAPIVQAPADPRNESTEPKPMADASGALPPSVANANAQLTQADANAAPPVPATDAAVPATTTPPAAQPSAAEHQIVAADEVNDLDRAAEAPAAEPAAAGADAAKLTLAQVQPAPAQTDSEPPAEAQVTAAAQDDGAWDKASLIGKIFIAAGGLLTLASAARMFIA